MSLLYSQSETNFSALASRWGHTPTTPEVCTAISEHSALPSDEPDYNLISDRWNLGVPYFKTQKLTGTAYVYDCAYVDKIERYMVSECAAELLRGELSHFGDFIKFQDGELIRPDLSALDDLLVEMVISNSTCQTIQGANCG